MPGFYFNILVTINLGSFLKACFLKVHVVGWVNNGEKKTRKLSIYQRLGTVYNNLSIGRIISFPKMLHVIQEISNFVFGKVKEREVKNYCTTFRGDSTNSTVEDNIGESWVQLNVEWHFLQPPRSRWTNTEFCIQHLDFLQRVDFSEPIVSRIRISRISRINDFSWGRTFWAEMFTIKNFMSFSRIQKTNIIENSHEIIIFVT